MRSPVSSNCLALAAAVLTAAAMLPACAPAGRELVRGPGQLRLEELTPPATQPASAPVQALSPAAGQLVTEAERRISRGDFQGAAGLLEEAAAQTGPHPRIAKDLGLAFLGLGDRTKALDYLRQAERTAGDDVLLQLLLGQLEAASGQTDQALLALRRALRCTAATPKEGLTAEVMLSLAELLAQEGYLTASEQVYARLSDAVEQHGRNYLTRPRLRPLVMQPGRLLARRGELLSHLGRHEQARRLLQQAYARDRTDTQAAELLLQADLDAKDFTAAEALLLDLAAEPTARERLPQLAEKLCEAAKDPALPARLWRTGRLSAVDPGALAVALAKAAKQLHADAEAREILHSALATRPNDVAVGCFVAEEHARAGDGPAALRQLAALLTANADATDAVLDAMDTMAQAGLLPEAVEDRVAADAAAETGDVKGVLHYLAGELAAIRGRDDLAAEQYQAAVAADGRFLPAYDAAADLYLEAGRFDQVEALVNRLEELAKSDPDVHYFGRYLAGKSDLAQGRLGAAARALEASTILDDRFAPAAELLAEAFGRLGMTDRAVKALDDLVTLEPDDERAYRRLFDLCVAMGRADQARAATVRFLRAHPDSRSGQAMLVELLVLTGNAEEGARLLNELQRQAGDDPAVRLLTVRLAVGAMKGAISRRQFDDWMTQIGQVLQHQGDSLSARRLLVDLLVRGGQHAQAAAVMGELYGEYPGLPDVAKAYVAELIHSGDRASARAVLVGNPMLQRDFQARQLLIEVLLEQGRLDEAAGFLRRWLGASSNRKFQDFCRIQLLGIYRNQREFAAAQRLIDQLLAANPPREGLVRLQAARVTLLALAGKSDQAVELIRSWTRDDDSVALKLVLTGALYDADCYSPAQKLLDEWLRRGGGDGEALAEAKLLGFARAGRLETVLRYARGWAARCPGALAPRRIAVGALAEAGQYDKALLLVQDWLGALEAPQAASAPTSQPWRGFENWLGRVVQASASAVMTSRQLGAMPAAKAASTGELADVRSWCREITVQLLLKTARTRKALDRVTAYVRAEPDNADLLSLQSAALSELGRDAESVAVMERAHRLAADDAGLCNNLGYLYAEAGTRLELAEALIRKALTDRPDERDFLDSLGWVLYKQGKLSEAGSVFQRLLEDGKAWPSSAVSYDHAGDVFYRLGWSEQAAEFWAQAVAHARGEKSPDRVIRRILTEAPAKIEAARTGLAAAVAPLGEGVAEEPEP